MAPLAVFVSSGRPDVVLYYHKQFMYLLIKFFNKKLFQQTQSVFLKSEVGLRGHKNVITAVM